MTVTTCPREGQTDSLWRWRFRTVRIVWRAANAVFKERGRKVPLRAHLLTAWGLLRCSTGICVTCHEPVEYVRGQWLHKEVVPNV